MLRCCKNVIVSQSSRNNILAVLESLRLLGCNLDGVNDHEIHLPIEISFHYDFAFYVDIINDLINIVIVIRCIGSLEYLIDIFGNDFHIKQVDDYFLITREMNEHVQLNVEELARSFLLLKMKSINFLS